MRRTGTRMAERGTRPLRHRRRSRAGLVKLVLLSVSLGCLGWLGYQYVGTDVVARRAFSEEKSSLRDRWAAESGRTSTGSTDPAATRHTGASSDPQQPGSRGSNLPGRSGRSTPPGGESSDQQSAAIPGEAIALLRIPAFGETYEVPILSGTDLPILDRGVGHYASTATPGQTGNFALAGHRATRGQPFARLLELNRGDEVIVETQDAVYTYVLDSAPRELTVPTSATWVLDPVPGQPGTAPTQPLITLTTCQDLFRSRDRPVGFGHLARTEPKS